MRKRLFTVLFMLTVCIWTSVSAAAACWRVDKGRVSESTIYDGTMYVPLREFCETVMPRCSVSWENGTAVVSAPGLYMTARPGEVYIEANGRALYVPDSVKLVDGRTMAPVRALAKALGCAVIWNADAHRADVSKEGGVIDGAKEYYDSDELMWLSRIIEAESGGEPLKGKIAVGNVVLNRVESDGFPGSIYDVIFDRCGGVQFEPVLNGTIYNEPSYESVLAAKLCLDGANTAGDSMFFLNPDIAQSFWMMETRELYDVIGKHWFYR